MWLEYFSASVFVFFHIHINLSRGASFQKFTLKYIKWNEMLLYCTILYYYTIKHHIKVSLLWVMKGSYFGFGSPQQQVGMQGQKTRSLSYNMHLFLPYSLND